MRSTYDSSCLLVSLTARKAVFVVKSDQVLKYNLNSAAWVLPGKINAIENCARYNRGLTTLPGEVNVRFIVLLSLFDRTQGHVRGGKAGRLT